MHDEFLEKIPKSTLVNNTGLTYVEFRKKMTPRWHIIWRDISLGWAALITLNLIIFFFSGHHWILDGLLLAGGSILIGYTIAYLQLFFHEAAHYNLYENRKINDFLCNLFISGIVGQDVRNYRPIHWDHHRYLGTTMDTEISYFDPLNIRFLLEAMFGVRALKVIFLRKKEILNNKKPSDTSSFPYVFFAGLIFNLTYLCFLFYLQKWILIAAWTAGVLIFFPFFGALRQLLEHRSEYADPTTDYTTIAHGAIHRIFGDGLFANTFGGAGFNRHLLHHWECQVSYTQLHNLEKYLMDTQYKDYLQQRKTTYWKTFCRIVFHPRWR